MTYKINKRFGLVVGIILGCIIGLMICGGLVLLGCVDLWINITVVVGSIIAGCIAGLVAVIEDEKYNRN